MGTSEELVEVYKMNIRAVIEYCAVVYHSLLTGEQSALLERLQYRALKCIYGINQSYRALLGESGLEDLKTRRQTALEKFAKKAQAGKFGHWFPKRNLVRPLRDQKEYLEETARCDRLKNSPIFAMRRVLNGESV